MTTAAPSTAITTGRAYGLWDSPLTPKTLAQGLRLTDVAWDTDGETLVWLEGRSDRGVLVTARLDDPAPRDLTADLSVRAVVGYGGGDFAVANGHVYFVSDGRIYRQPIAGGAARPITPGFGHAASPAVSPDGRWVLYVHTYEDTDVLALVDAEGTHWPVKVAEGRDFYMQPCWHPGGDRLAWIGWDHPQMPWDGTELWVAEIDLSGDQPRPGRAERLAGDASTSISGPGFSPDGRSIAYVSDAAGWSHLYLQDLGSGETRQITHGEVEYGRPAWTQGLRTFAFLGDGRRIAAVREGAFQRLQLFDTRTGEAQDAGPDAAAYDSIEMPAASPDGSRLAAIVGGPAQPPRVVSFELGAAPARPSTVLTSGATGAVSYEIPPGSRVWARSMGETVPAAALSSPQEVSWTSFDGEQAHGLFYPPTSERFHAPGLPPLIVLVHGGPTSQVTASYQAQGQFFATRGYAVLYVNYRGSTGYGRDYMLKLRGSWGIYDVEDSISGARALAERGLVDPVRRVIMGGSAGGFTVLQTLVTHPGAFTAGICLFGVANQFGLAADTHKFEARYLDSILGPLPESAALYRDRSPVFHAERIKDPIAVFQGEIDQVVPKAQSDEIVASLKARGVPHEYHIYPGEGHGWRKTETIESFYQSVDRFLRQYVVFA